MNYHHLIACDDRVERNRIEKMRDDGFAVEICSLCGGAPVHQTGTLLRFGKSFDRHKSFEIGHEIHNKKIEITEACCVVAGIRHTIDHSARFNNIFRIDTEGGRVSDNGFCKRHIHTIIWLNIVFPDIHYVAGTQITICKTALVVTSVDLNDFVVGSVGQDYSVHRLGFDRTKKQHAEQKRKYNFLHGYFFLQGNIFLLLEVEKILRAV
ncbi:hypothetical protein DSECCO2_522700 [anaerobic digester metagenome]